jgi:hypothetical protein
MARPERAKNTAGLVIERAPAPVAGLIDFYLISPREACKVPLKRKTATLLEGAAGWVENSNSGD